MSKEVICGIYCLTDTRNGYKYVGQSVDINSREYTHFNRLEKGVHENLIIQRIFNKHGNVFTHEIIELCLEEELNEREIFWIDKLKTFTNSKEYTPKGYNMDKGGKGLRGYGIPCYVMGEIYQTKSEASRIIGIPVHTIMDRILSNSLCFKEYCLVDDNNNPIYYDEYVDRKVRTIPPNFSVDGVIYDNYSLVGRIYGISSNAVKKRIKSENPKFKDWFYKKPSTN